MSGDTPIDKAISQAKAIDKTNDNRYIFYHGTDLASAIALLNGAPLEISIALKKRHDIGDLGFYLATHYDVAYHYATVRGTEGTILQYLLTQQALSELIGSGCIFKKITPGKNFYPPGLELFVPPTSFASFNMLRETEQIQVLPD